MAELAKKYGLPLPRPAEQLYQWPNFDGFLEILRLTASVLRTPEDFSRAVYEYCEDARRDGNLRHVEFFFNPDYFYPNGIDYPSMVAGMVDGIGRVERAFGISARLICCIDRSINSPAQAVEIVETALAHRHELVIGIGLDGNESVGPPATFAEAYALARKGGLRCTAHCCEDYLTPLEAPPTNYLICRDVLRCDRIDHGYNMLASDFVMSEARKDGLYFTPCAWTSLLHNRPHRPQRIRRMVEAGLNVTINTDDPAMFGTNLGHGFTTLFDTIGWGPDMARKFSLNSVEGSWLDESDKTSAADRLPPPDRRPRQGIRLREQGDAGLSLRFPFASPFRWGGAPQGRRGHPYARISRTSCQTFPRILLTTAGMRQHARSLRTNATDAERILWRRLRRRQLAGFKFRRQHQVGLYICDFVCLEARLVVELDGSQHAENQAYDARRDHFLASAGFKVLRFWNNEVMARTEDVLETIYSSLDGTSDPSGPAGHLPI